MSGVSEESIERVVIRDDDYYGGSLWVESPSPHGYPRSHVRIIWEAYQGGGAVIELQDAGEMEKVGKLLLAAADMVDEDRIDRGPEEAV